MDSEGECFSPCLMSHWGSSQCPTTVSPAQILAGLELWGPQQCPEVVAAVFVDLQRGGCTVKEAEKEARPLPSVGHFPP